MCRKTKRPKGRGKPRRAVAVQDAGTGSSLVKSGLLSQKLWAKVVNQVASAPSSKDDQSDSSFLHSGTYCGVGYSSIHVTSEYQHLRQDTNFQGPGTVLVKQDSRQTATTEAR